MKKQWRMAVVLILTLSMPAQAGIPMSDILSLAQRVANWAKKAAEWVDKIDQFTEKKRLLDFFKTDNWIFSRGFKIGLEEIKDVRSDLEQLERYFDEVCDLRKDTWSSIFEDGKDLQFKYPDISDYEPFKQNILSKNKIIKEIIDKAINLQKDKLNRINQLAKLIKDINNEEKAIAKKIGELQKSLEKSAEISGPQHAGQTGKVLFNHAVVRLHTLRTKIYGNATMRTISEFRLKSAVEEKDWQNYIDKTAGEDSDNYTSLGGSK